MHADQCELPAPPVKGASYEQWYNSGTAAAAAGETGQALERLMEALQQCRILLQEEGAGEEELQQEQAIIRWAKPGGLKAEAVLALCWALNHG